MIIEQYVPTYLSTADTTVIFPSGNCTLHTVVIPAALTDTVTFESTEDTPTTYFVLPAESVGSFRFDCVLPLGLQVVTAAADTVIVNAKKS